MAREQHTSFVGWVVVSYFSICGGLLAASIGLALSGHQSKTAALVAVAAGAAVGGFFAGRASPHRSYVEPAVAGLLVVASVVAFAYAMPMGRMAIGIAGDDLYRAASLVGGVALVGGLVGAAFGELSAGDGVHPGVLRWAGLSILLTLGALFASAIVAGGLVVNEAAEEALADYWNGRDPARNFLDEERIVVAVALTLGAASFLGGFVTQMAAPRRLLSSSLLGPFVVVAALVAGAGAAVGEIGEATVPALITGALAATIALLGAVLGWIVRKAAGAF